MRFPFRSLLSAAALAAFIVSVSPATADDDHVVFIQASAHNAGLADTLWVTDARVFNPDAVEPIEVWLAFLPPGADNSGVTEEQVVVGPRQAAELDDVVASLFGEARAGAIRLRSSHDLLATSRTYNLGDGSSGTYGQFISAVAADAALPHGILLQLANDPDPSGFRTNVGFVNPSTDPCTVTFDVFDVASATRLGSGSVTLEPLGFRQVNDVFQFVGAGEVVVRNASVEFAAEPEVLAYASVVDNTSGDPIFVSPFADTGTPATANNPPQGTILTPSGDLTVAPGDTVTFTGTASDPDGDEVTVLWDFGDGMTSTELNPGDHTYAEPGTFTVTFTATDEYGLADPTPDTRTITVTSGGANQPPNGVITQPAGDATVALGDAVAFAGTASDPDGDQVTVLWSFGDGGTSTQLSPGNYTYASAGTFTVTFTATDAHGLADPTPDTRTITVTGGGANQPPNGVITQPAGDVTVALGDAVAFAGTASDPDGDQVTVLWSFGDGGTSTQLSPGNYTYASAGTFTVTFTATDAHGLADPTPDTRTITVQAPNNPPNGTITQPAGDLTITLGDAVTFAGTASDPDGDQVTVLWSFGDGGTSTQLSPGNYTYASAGTFTVTFTATDAHGLADPTPDTRTITVQAPNNPPNGTITQPAGNVTINAGDSVSFAGSVSDPDGDQVTVLWDFGDGITSTQLVPGAHTYSNAGIYTVTFTATDVHGLPDPTPDSRTITVNAAGATLTQVQTTIFTPRCIGCHGGGNPTAGMNLEAGQAFSNLVNVPATTLPGLRVVPFSPDTSALVIQLEGGHRNLPQSDIQLIRDWITAGALDN